MNNCRNYVEFINKILYNRIIEYVLESPPGPDSTSTSKSLTCGQCGMTFNTTQELAEHNRKEHGMA
jgi:hypothetical protein